MALGGLLAVFVDLRIDVPYVSEGPVRGLRWKRHGLSSGRRGGLRHAIVLRRQLQRPACPRHRWRRHCERRVGLRGERLAVGDMRFAEDLVAEGIGGHAHLHRGMRPAGAQRDAKAVLLSAALHKDRGAPVDVRYAPAAGRSRPHRGGVRRRDAAALHSAVWRQHTRQRHYRGPRRRCRGGEQQQRRRCGVGGRQPSGGRELQAGVLPPFRVPAEGRAVRRRVHATPLFLHGGLRPLQGLEHAVQRCLLVVPHGVPGGLRVQRLL
mmetsp:Transcript_120924/g.349390  ORF Transcript_120924/g.349390 Transcript_120924/m.349390 type:complete len:265 (+) Transcript_120924:450-1244(+)